MNHRRKITILVLLIVCVFVFWDYSSNSLSDMSSHSGYTFGPQFKAPDNVIMSKMGNETLKAQLGRSTWHLLHTMAGKFPLHPTKDEQQAFLDFIRLFAQLYPCGDCARHFQRILHKHPPRVDNRNATSQWACEVHNIVNVRLNKTIFDCATVNDVWKCGCAEEDSH
ncbi:ERV/ALR sulfhydryl oxidase domain-containing protein [Gorgonomyces haynaldii]|nr:ERV/ALR sulfhydryl oxidase domain-containing protein [Gorgonomyces haynaldii]